jgi:transcriptional regulator with XRE-family HTH domain
MLRGGPRIDRKLGAEHQGERLRRLRIVMGKLRKRDGTPYTHDEMADILGVVQQTYSAFENSGRVPQPPVLAVFRDAFDVTADWILLGDDDNMPPLLTQALNDVGPDELRAIMKKRR